MMNFPANPFDFAGIACYNMNVEGDRHQLNGEERTVDELAEAQVKAVVDHLRRKADREWVGNNASKAWKLEVLASNLEKALDETNSVFCRLEMLGED
jgi:hypothetical protein